MTGLRRGRRRQDERGAIAIITALSLVLVLVAAAMVMDFGLVRVDRQVDKAAADSATLAGLHAMNTGDGSSHPYVGVCTALQYLKSNDSRFAGLTESTGWTNGLGAGTASGCSDVALRTQKCIPTNKATWAKFAWSGTWQGTSLKVTVESGYSLTGSTWAEDSLPASSADTGDANQQGCDQLAVTIEQSRKPGLGSLATSSNLVTSIRSVGRVKPVPGHSAPALLLLQRTGCPNLTAPTGGTTFIHVIGVLTSHGTSAPGTIHSDSDGVGCTGGSNSNVFVGRQDSGIVAYAAPQISNPTAPDPTKPGTITSVAAANGAALSVVRDSPDNVYGSDALTSGGTRTEVSGRTLIGRTPVDQRYRPTVATAMSNAAAVFTAGSSNAPDATWTTLTSCSPTQAQLPALNQNSKLYIKCNNNNGFTGGGLTINAGTVFFNNVVNPSGSLSMPNATKVYVAGAAGKTDGLSIGSGASFQMNNAAPNLSGGQCYDGTSATRSIATLFVQQGDIKESNNGTLQLCRTTLFMLGGKVSSDASGSAGCVPLTDGTAPTLTPCPGINSGLGSGQFTQQGGSIDWTAPDTVDQTLDPTTQAPLPAALAAWSNVNGPEDLALWSESAGTSNSGTYNMNGGGGLHVRGVFMIPNATPFSLGGNSVMNLTNAQFIVSTLALNGTPLLTLSVNPDSAVTLPDLGLVGLVR